MPAQGFEILVDFVDRSGVRQADGVAFVSQIEEDETAAWSAIAAGSVDAESVDCDVQVNYTLADDETIDLLD